MKLCESCKWWVKKHEPCGDGECRRYAPRIICGAGTGFARWEWPTTRNSSGCGEWEEKSR